MTQLSWDDISKRNFEYGLDRGVFYPKESAGYAWNGLVKVDESTPDTTQSLIYIDGVGHRNRLLFSSFAATISAITYPKEFEPYDGYSGVYTGQRRKEFDFTYRTMQMDGHYKIHLVYNALATPSTRANSTINNSVDVELLAWDITTRNEHVAGAQSSSHFVIDTINMYPDTIGEFEAMLYGSDISYPYMPTVTQLLEFFDSHAILKITDHGDGTWTAEGPDDVVELLDPTSFQINWVSAIPISADTYTVRSF